MASNDHDDDSGSDGSEHVGPKYELIRIAHTFSKKFNTQANKYVINIQPLGAQNLQEGIEIIEDIFSQILGDILQNVNPDDMVRLVLQNPNLDLPIHIPFVKKTHLTVERILAQISKVAQSNKSFLLEGELTASVFQVVMDGGGVYLKQGVCYDFMEFLHRKKSVITIQNSDDICMSRALVVGRAHVDKDPRLKQIIAHSVSSKGGTHRFSLQKKLALELHRKAGVPMRRCSIADASKFQAVLSGYQIVIYSADQLFSIVYSGYPESEKKIVLLLTKGHYHLITKVPAFFADTHYCAKCNKCYHLKWKHRCENTCLLCNNQPVCEKSIPDPNHRCVSCEKTFHNMQCYQNHLENRVCEHVKICTSCGKMHSTRYNHVCGKKFCRLCFSWVEENHLCYIQPAPSNALGNEEFKYIIYDFETMLTEDREHVPFLCISLKVCHLCHSMPTDASCNICGKHRLNIIEGENVAVTFTRYLLQKENHHRTVFAHGGKKFDFIYVLRALHDEQLIPRVIMTGSSVMFMEIPVAKIKFLDTFNFMRTSLAAMPALLGLPENELQKGMFPFLFAKRENLNYVGKIPDVEFFNVQGMKSNKLKDFLAWYRSIPEDYIFSFHQESRKYCLQDVKILTACVIKFRDLMINMADIDPFKKCITMSSLCLEIYKRCDMPPDSIGLVPRKGYIPHVNQSRKAIAYMEYLSVQRDVHITHQFNSPTGEKRVMGLPVDGFYKTSDGRNKGHIVQFLGCLYHSHLEHYTPKLKHPLKDTLTFGEVYEHTMRQLSDFEQANYATEHIWECEFDKLLAQDKMLSSIYKSIDIQPCMTKSSALYGGRTETFTTYYHTQGAEQIKYVDINSMYGFVMKKCTFPLGHPTVYRDPEKLASLDFTQVVGIANIRVLPCDNIFHPCLPYRTNHKLTFPLCATCADTNQQTPCHHSDNQRAWVGCYTNFEIALALEKNYKILKCYEAWVYDKHTTYDEDSKTGGLFASFVQRFYHTKLAASGYPDNCHDENSRKNYLREVYEREGIQLDPAEVKVSPEKRNYSKRILASLWGKMSQSEHHSQVRYISEPGELYAMLLSNGVVTEDILLVNDETVQVTYKFADGFEKQNRNISPIVASFVTAHARNYLFRFLDRLGERCLYCDTDSLIFKISDESDFQIETGPFLGQFKNELDSDDYIVKFVSTGPKSYSFLTHKNKRVTKVKGICLTNKNESVINLEAMERLVRECPTDKITTETLHCIKREKRTRRVFNKTERKEFRFCFDKRQLADNHISYPFGYKHDKHIN